MPTKYTYTQVQEIFLKNNCILKSETYENQTKKLEYIASCGHVNSNIFKDFLNGYGIKCKNCALEIPTYENVSNKFLEKGCNISMTKEEFLKNYKNNTCKINYIASCGHENIVSYKNFTTLNQGINCPSCVNKNTSTKLKDLYSNNNKLSSLEQELKCLNYVKELISDYFTTIRCFDGCKSDFVIQKFDEIEDLWVGIQVKTTLKKTDRSQYYFRLNKGKYEDCIILCVCEEDKKMWLIPYEEVNGLKTIGIAQKSKYNKYEINKENLIEKFSLYYDICIKKCFVVLDTPTSKSQQQEQEYCKLRETTINFIKFTPNPMEGLVYDFKIGNKKIQEKVGSITHNNNNSYCFHINKYDCRINGKCKNKSYEEGDNDFYWLNCKNGKFYVIPENDLIENEFVGKGCKKIHLYVSPTNVNTSWCNKYLFDYNNIDKERLLNLLDYRI